MHGPCRQSYRSPPSIWRAPRFDALTQGNRANHMTLVEAWADRKAFDDHIVAGHEKRFREALGPMIGSLYDERLYTLIE